MLIEFCPARIEFKYCNAIHNSIIFNRKKNRASVLLKFNIIPDGMWALKGIFRYLSCCFVTVELCIYISDNISELHIPMRHDEDIFCGIIMLKFSSCFAFGMKHWRKVSWVRQRAWLFWPTVEMPLHIKHTRASFQIWSAKRIYSSFGK